MTAPALALERPDPRLDRPLAPDLCEAEAAIRYGFEGLEPPAPWTARPCGAGPLSRVVLLRSRATGSHAELSWRVYGVCGAHAADLRRRDEAVLHAGHRSQLHPLSGAVPFAEGPSLVPA